MKILEKPILYAETSYWMRIVDRQDPARRRPTRRFQRWSRGRYRLRASALVVQELRENMDQDLGQRAMAWFARHRPRVVPTTPAVWRVAEELHESLRRGPKAFADSLHLAYAMVRQARAVVTWDTDDLARAWTRERVRSFCESRQWGVPMIGTPVEVREWHTRGML
jgi:predicted nucleic acid-binding protein